MPRVLSWIGRPGCALFSAESGTAPQWPTGRGSTCPGHNAGGDAGLVPDAAARRPRSPRRGTRPLLRPGVAVGLVALIPALVAPSQDTLAQAACQICTRREPEVLDPGANVVAHMAHASGPTTFGSASGQPACWAPGSTGQASPQPIVISRYAPSVSSDVCRYGTANAKSMPSSRIAFTTSTKHVDRRLRGWVRDTCHAGSQQPGA